MVLQGGLSVYLHVFIVQGGLCVCIVQGGLIFVCGSREGLMEVSGRRHNTDDIIATVLAVEPMKFIYRGRSLPTNDLINTLLPS